MAGRSVIAKLPSIYFSSRSVVFRALSSPLARSSPLLRFRPLLAAADYPLLRYSPAASSGQRCFSTRPTTSSLNDPSPNWSNRPPKETILLDGCDFEHWLIVMEAPDPSWTRDEIIDSYIKTLAQVLGSEEEARMSIYSVSTKHYFAFGCKVSEEISYKIKPLQKVRWVLPDSYLDVKNKDYGGEPFIDGKAVPYDPKYHEEWVRNNARAQERSRRNDRPRNFDRSRNFERRRENMQNFQNREAPPMPNQGVQNTMPPQDVPPTSNSMPNYQNQMPNPQSNHMPPNTGGGYQGSGQSYQGTPGYHGGQGYQGGAGNPGGNMRGGPGYPGANPGNYQGGAAGYQGTNPGNYQGGGPAYQGNNPGYQGNSPPYQGGYPGYQPSNAGYQGGAPNYQQGVPSNQEGAPPYPGRDMPGRDQ
ncbi:multiple organellar RNA editing factor 8, chloroplastic/mitochondrial-like isoform X1 [Canna indica]|uniref:Multiple organellar RNA editing factor 8, chloroplastic/mitochondrial-like isoform X1 n=1 Tax=Canna indica TaxID=4628 RepID=A0AAQ3KVP0_9LILI|nr:multiple organellar RNA editing factor 8, chloroplastic/mitochondrial-like isoform X1 [Canna indica]